MPVPQVKANSKHLARCHYSLNVGYCTESSIQEIREAGYLIPQPGSHPTTIPRTHVMQSNAIFASEQLTAFVSVAGHRAQSQRKEDLDHQMKR